MSVWCCLRGGLGRLSLIQWGHMKTKAVFLLAFALGACSTPEAAEPGITTIAPGVVQIDGAKVRGGEVDLPALEALLAKKGPMQDVVEMIGKAPMVNPAAGGTDAHMYRLEDRATKRKVLIIVFAQNGRVADSLMTVRTG